MNTSLHIYVCIDVHSPDFLILHHLLRKLVEVKNKERNQQLLKWINTSRLSLLQLISLILVVSTCDSH